MTTETVQFNLLFDASTDRARAGITGLTGQLDRLGNKAAAEAARVRASFSAMGGQALGGVRTALSGIQSQLGGFSTEAGGATRQLAQFAGGLSPAGGQLVTLAGAGGAAALGVAAVGAACIAGALAAGKFADAIDDTANSISVSNGFLQIQQAAITRAGGDAEAFAKSMNKMNILVGEAAMGNETAAAAFSTLGVSIRDEAGKLKDNAVIFAQTREALAGVSSETERAALAKDIFGKSAKDMAGILGMSAAEYAALTEEVASYGVASDENIAKAGKLGDGMDALGQAMRAGIINNFAGLAEQLGNFAISIAPMVNQAFNVIGEVMDLVGGVASILWEGLTALWDVFDGGVKWVLGLVSPLGTLSRMFKSTGGSATSLKDQFFDALQSMLDFGARAAGALTRIFVRMGANIRNAMADVTNGLVDSGIGRFVGLNVKVEKVDANALAEAAGNAISTGIRNTGTTVIARARNRFNGSGAAADDRRDDGVSRGAGAGGSGGGASAADKAAEATKKYQEALDGLIQAQREVAYTEEQKAIRDALTRAGLPPLIDATDERTTAIRNEVLALRELEAEQRANKQIEQMTERTRDAMLSAEELAKVEARRAAGVSTNLAVTNEYIARLDAQAAASYRAADAAAKLQANLRVQDELNKGSEDAYLDLREARDGRSPRLDYEREVLGIQRSTEALRERIIASTTEGEARDRQIQQMERIRDVQLEIAAAYRDTAEADQTQEMVDTLGDKIIDLWEGGKEAFRSFLKEVLIGFAKMAAFNLLDGKVFSGGQGIGGMFKSVLGSVLGGGFGGFKASGGPVKAGQGHIVGENGREYFRPMTDGVILPAGSFGGGTTTNHISVPFTYHAAPGVNPADDQQEAARMDRWVQGKIKAAFDAAGIRS